MIWPADHHSVMNGFDWMGISGGLWMVVGIILIVVIGWAIVAAVSRRDQAGVDDAGRILKARFARGELTPEDYERARRLLGV